MTTTQVCQSAHRFADAFLTRHGKVPSDMIDNAKFAAHLAGLTGNSAELFVDRAVGHWVNVQCGPKGA